jgi:hypothetical protein
MWVPIPFDASVTTATFAVKFFCLPSPNIFVSFYWYVD